MRVSRLATLLHILLVAACVFAQSAKPPDRSEQASQFWQTVRPSSCSGHIEQSANPGGPRLYRCMPAANVVKSKVDAGSTHASDAQMQVGRSPQGVHATTASSSTRLHLEECEGPQCGCGAGLWILNAGEGYAGWECGAAARLTVTSFDGTHLSIHREDLDTSFGSGFTSDYEGTIVNDQISGTMTRSWPGHEVEPSGTWTAWIARSDPEWDDKKFSCPSVPGHPEAIAGPLRAAITFSDAKDFKSAFCYFQMSALRDRNGLGAENLAIAYGGGRGVPQDIAKARRWAITAAKWHSPLPAKLNQDLGLTDWGQDKGEYTNEQIQKALTVTGLAMSLALSSGDGRWSQNDWSERCGSSLVARQHPSECVEHQHDWEH